MGCISRIGSICTSLAVLSALAAPAFSGETDLAHVYVDMYLSPFLNQGVLGHDLMDLLWAGPEHPDRYAGARDFRVYTSESRVELRGGLRKTPVLQGYSWSCAISPCLLDAPGGTVTAGVNLSYVQPAPLPAGEYHVGTLTVYDIAHPPGVSADFPLLPATTVDGGWKFGFSVTDITKPFFIDPLVAIGYDYFVDSGPNFSSVLPPSVGDSLYDLWLWDEVAGSWLDSGIDLTGNSQHDFAAGGVNRFRLLGIEASAGLDPADDTAFVTGLWFTGTGPVTMRQVPISVDTEAVPAPGALVLLCVGLAGLNAGRRKVA